MGTSLNYKHSELTSEIIKAAYYVHDYFGYGHLESIYEKAMAIKLRKEGFHVKMQAPLQVYFEGELIGNFKADLVVNDSVIIELKSVKSIHPRHEVQLVNYLKCINLEVGLIMNFGEELKFKRKIYSNHVKRANKFIP